MDTWQEVYEARAAIIMNALMSTRISATLKLHRLPMEFWRNVSSSDR